MTTLKDYLTTEEAAAELDVRPARVRQLIAAGIMKSERFGKSHVIPRAEIARARARKTEPGPVPGQKPKPKPGRKGK